MGPNRRPVALLQLESYYGLCILIQLRYFSQTAAHRCLLYELKQLLGNYRILKIGVAPQKDANFLFQDFDIETSGTFDLRFMAKMAGYEQPGGLKKMCENYLNIPNYGEDILLHYHWEDNHLTSQATQYAANDVHRSIDLFEFFAKKIQFLNPLKKRSSYIKRIINKCYYDGHLDYYYESCFNNRYRGPKVCEEFDRICQVWSKQSEKEYRIPKRKRCFVCNFFEVHHTYFPCKFMII